MKIGAVGVAYPWQEKDRRELLEAMPRHRIPPTKPGSTLRRCAHCWTVMVVGPRLDASGITIICALCAHKIGVEGFQS